MALSIKTLIAELDRVDLLADFKAVGALLGLTTTAWQEGEPIYDALVIFSDRFASIWNTNVVPWMRSKFLDFASGDLLTVRAWTDYKRYRGNQTRGTASLTIENRGGGFHTITAGTVRVKNAAGKTFTNTTGGTLSPWVGSGPFPTLTMVFQADEAGSGPNTAPGGVLPYPTPLTSGSANVYALTNVGAFQGSDEEKDALLKERCRISTGPLSPGGPRRAYESVALDVRRNAAGDPAMPDPFGDAATYAAAAALNITRVHVMEPGNNVVRVLLASSSGAAAGDVSTPGTDVFIANVAMQLWACPAGMTLITEAATELPVAIGVITLYVDRASLVTKEEAEADALAALNDFFRVFPIAGMRKVPGFLGTLYKGTIEGIAQASNKGIFEVDANSFTDVTVAATKVVVPSFTVNAVLVTQ
jgi:hypothetical protein